MSGGERDWMEVVGRVARGDRAACAAVGRLLTGHLARLRAYDFRDAWDDLRSEVVLAALANVRAGRLRDSRALAAYLRIATRNKFVDRLKQHLDCDAGQPLPWDDETARALAAEADQPRARRLWHAVGELPPDEQRLIDEVYRQGKSYEEASAATGLPVGTTKRRLRTALMALRVRLAGVRTHGVS